MHFRFQFGNILPVIRSEIGKEQIIPGTKPPQVQYMPEGFMGWDQTSSAVNLGTVDEFGVVHFNNLWGYGPPDASSFEDMPLSELEKLGSHDSLGDLGLSGDSILLMPFISVTV